MNNSGSLTFAFSECDGGLKRSTKMRNAKSYTNQTFTKRVDHDGGLHREPRKLAEPTFCQECRAIYSGGRWVHGGAAETNSKHKHWRPANSVRCPACKQIQNGTAGGYVSIGGDFLKEHGSEIQNLVENESARALEDNPLSRIIKREAINDRLIIETTTEHLAQRLGHALKKAFDGEVQYNFSHENKMTRVLWNREY
jgi:hypothetical protein